MKSKFFSSLLLNGTLAVICLLWTIPTLGLLISSFRDRNDISSTGMVYRVPPPGLDIRSENHARPRRGSLFTHDIGRNHRHL